MTVAASFLVILAACGLYGLLHSLLASHAAKRLAQLHCGPTARRWYRLAYSLLGGLLLLPIFVLVWKLPDRQIYRIPFPWLLLTALAQLAAGIGLVYGVLQTGGLRFVGLRQALNAGGSEELIAGRKPDELAINGLYRWVRHPLYSCGLIILWLTPLMSWNVLALDLGLTAYILIGLRFEERKLLAEFGQAYAEYRRRTPALLPRLRR
jgi:protein-S-isoprenylcysteine O-methyltransferase Ste14